MTPTRQSRFTSLRALCAALALLIGSIAAPVALASRTSADVCSMACCVEEGHCCCKPRRAYVEGKTADDKPRIAENKIAAPCPEGCTTSPASSNSSARQALRPADHKIDVAPAPLRHSPSAIGKALAMARAAGTPRAPPVLPAYIAD